MEEYQKLFSNPGLSKLVSKKDFKETFLAVLKIFHNYKMCTYENRVTITREQIFNGIKVYDKIELSLCTDKQGKEYLSVLSLKLIDYNGTGIYIETRDIYDDNIGQIGSISCKRISSDVSLFLLSLENLETKLSPNFIFHGEIPFVDKIQCDNFTLSCSTRIEQGIVKQKKREYVKGSTVETLYEAIDHYVLDPRFPRKMIKCKKLSSESTTKTVNNEDSNRQLIDYNSVFPKLWEVIADGEAGYQKKLTETML